MRKQPGVWHVEAHNPTDKPIKTSLQSQEGWTPFRFKESTELLAGSSKVWTLAEAR